MNLAITGATGFVGGRLLELALAEGHRVRALTRRPQPERDGVIWVDGSLDDPDSLDRLVEGVDAAIHVAGVVNARDEAGFEAGNVTGTAAMVEAAHLAKVERFVHVSSLAAREPKLSMYGASKARSEELVGSAPLDWTIVRPSRMTDGPMTGNYLSGERLTVGSGTISRADVAHFLLQAAGDPRTVGKTLLISQ